MALQLLTMVRHSLQRRDPSSPNSLLFLSLFRAFTHPCCSIQTALAQWFGFNFPSDMAGVVALLNFILHVLLAQAAKKWNRQAEEKAAQVCSMPLHFENGQVL